jgi:hypothetical protein
MARLRVHIRLDLLRAHLSAEDRQPKSEADVLTWLGEAGFGRADGPWWLVDELDLGQLRSAEVIAVEDALTIRAAPPAATAATAAAALPNDEDTVEAA